MEQKTLIYYVLIQSKEKMTSPHPNSLKKNRNLKATADEKTVKNTNAAIKRV